MTLKQLYEIIIARRDSAEQDLMREYRAPNNNLSKIHRLKGEIEAYNSVLNEINYYGMAKEEENAKNL